MRPAAFALALALLAACAVPRSAAARRGGGRGEPGAVVLAGERVPVRWTDGDSFRIEGGRHAGRRARLAGVNTLETFGPVHRLGASDGAELLPLARASAARAAAQTWRCETDGREGGYGRLLVSCPDAALALVAEGHAMVFAVDAPADPRLLAAQRAAQAARRGIWRGGAPPLVPSSLHSADEPDLQASGAYDRVVDTRTGAAERRPHARRYAVCEEVCLGEGEGRACLVYVPYARWYRNRPPCIAPARRGRPAVTSPGSAAGR